MLFAKEEGEEGDNCIIFFSWYWWPFIKESPQALPPRRKQEKWAFPFTGGKGNHLA